jgi:hypothetical protein
MSFVEMMRSVDDASRDITLEIYMHKHQRGKIETVDQIDQHSGRNKHALSLAKFSKIRLK